MTAKGKVYLVGAGPGDPGLITVKGRDCIGEADVIIYDRLVDERLLGEARPGADLLYAGKSAQRHTLNQEEINRLLIAKAEEGKTVVRLKGGDPFVFGHGGEEAEALVSKGIPFEVVPGVTSAVAVPAYAGIPLTHRDMASSFAVVTGHEAPGKTASAIKWDKLATATDTLVFLMGAANLSEIVQQLVRHGRTPETPVALIEQGTTSRQRAITATLEDIVERAEQEQLQPPAVIVVGSVVELRGKLRWFDNRPLFGKRILVTRARSQAGRLSRLLSLMGAEPVEMPVIEIKPALDYRQLDHALYNVSQYDWIIFTSVNGVDVFFNRLASQGKDVRQLKDVRLCAIGPATAESLQRLGLKADLVPPVYTTEGVLAALEKESVAGKNILLARAQQANPELAPGLSHLGAKVADIFVYRTISPRQAPTWQRLLKGEVDIVTFTSSSTVRHLVDMLGDEVGVLNKVKIACIGPVTAATAKELGLKVDIIAREHTIPGLVQAIADTFTAVERS